MAKKRVKYNKLVDALIKRIGNTEENFIGNYEIEKLEELIDLTTDIQNILCTAFNIFPSDLEIMSKKFELSDKTALLLLIADEYKDFKSDFQTNRELLKSKVNNLLAKNMLLNRKYKLNPNTKIR